MADHVDTPDQDEDESAAPVVARDDGDDSELVFVLHHEWSIEGESFDAGLNRIKDPSPELIRLASHAHAAGVLEVEKGLDLSDVQSQEDGEAEYAAAVEDGRWLEGQEIQAALDAEARDRGDATIVVDVTEEEQP